MKILITGATSGIGKAFVEKYRHKAEIIAVGRDSTKLNQLGVEFLLCDLSNSKEVENLPVKDVDVLVNNAGVGVPTDLSEISEEEYDMMYYTNVKGLVFLSKQYIKQFLKKGTGHIVNIGSTAGLKSNPVAPIYASTKHALEGYTDGLKMQLKGTGVRVSIIRPDMVDTNYWGERDVPRDKFMTAEEVADTIWFVINTPKSMNVANIEIESNR